MSIPLTAQVLAHQVGDLKTDKDEIVKASTCKAVLIALAEHANGYGDNACPSITLIEKETELSRPTVIAALNALKRAGYIIPDGMSAKYGTNNYTVNVKMISNPARQAPEVVNPVYHPEDEVVNPANQVVNPVYQPEDEVVNPANQVVNPANQPVDSPSKPSLLKPLTVNELTNSESAQKTRAVCNQSPQWAIAHGDIPEPLSEAEQFRLDLNSALDRMPQDVRALAETYMAETRRVCASYETAKWVKSLRQMRQQNITPDVLRETILDMRQRGTLNTWPGSCLNLAAMKVASTRRVENELPTYQPPDWWSNTPIIPTTRPNLKGPANAG